VFNYNGIGGRTAEGQTVKVEDDLRQRENKLFFTPQELDRQATANALVIKGKRAVCMPLSQWDQIMRNNVQANKHGNTVSFALQRQHTFKGPDGQTLTMTIVEAWGELTPRETVSVLYGAAGLDDHGNQVKPSTLVNPNPASGRNAIDATLAANGLSQQGLKQRNDRLTRENRENNIFTFTKPPGDDSKVPATVGGGGGGSNLPKVGDPNAPIPPAISSNRPNSTPIGNGGGKVIVPGGPNGPTGNTPNPGNAPGSGQRPNNPLPNGDTSQPNSLVPATGGNGATVNVDPKTYFEWMRAGRDLKNVSVNLLNADLRGADLSGLDLRGIDLRGANLSEANLSNVNLSDADLTGAQFKHTNFSNTILTGASLRYAQFTFFNLNNVDLANADLSFATLTAGYLWGAILANVNLTKSELVNVELSEANLSGANLTSARMQNVNFTGASLNDVDATKAEFIRTNFTNAIIDNMSVCQTSFMSPIFDGIDVGRFIDWPLRGISMGVPTAKLRTLTNSDTTSSPQFDIDAILRNSDKPFGQNPYLVASVSKVWADYFIENSQNNPKLQQEMTERFFPQPRLLPKKEKVSEMTWSAWLAFIETQPADTVAQFRKLLPEPMKHASWTQRQALAWASHYEEAVAWIGWEMIDSVNPGNGIDQSDFARLTPEDQMLLAEQLCSSAKHADDSWLWTPHVLRAAPAIDYDSNGRVELGSGYAPPGTGKVLTPYPRRSLSAP
jgi:uncharacterized protein YjbI with pentapeptide repeats